jgi:vacuolar-type H+-ATPase subunit H
MSSESTGIAGFEGPASVIDAQVQAMLQRVAENRDRSCAQLVADASAKAQGILRAARTEARANVVEAVTRERKQGEQVLQLAQASVVLEERRREQQEMLCLLKEMWASITGALESRWADAPGRKSWVRAAVRQARALLSAHAWRIEHGAGWTQQELDELERLVLGGARGDSADDNGAAREVELIGDNGLGTGLRIRTEGACLDATVAGLLASRTRIESDFLAEFLALSPAPERSVS